MYGGGVQSIESCRRRTEERGIKRQHDEAGDVGTRDVDTKGEEDLDQQLQCNGALPLDTTSDASDLDQYISDSG